MDIQGYKEQIKALEKEIQQTEEKKAQQWFLLRWFLPRDDSRIKRLEEKITELRAEIKDLRAIQAGVGVGRFPQRKFFSTVSFVSRVYV